MDIITGYVGSPHVTAEQDRDINIGIFGAESYVLRTGSQLKAEVSSNNEIKIRDGVIMHQGCAASIKKNTYDSLTIVNGSQGMKRIDLVVARYSRNQSTKVESLTLKVIQGTPVTGTPSAPGYTTGDIQAGDLVADMPLYQVVINGLNITAVKQVFNTVDTVAELNGKLNRKITYDETETGEIVLGEKVYSKSIWQPHLPNNGIEYFDINLPSDASYSWIDSGNSYIYKVGYSEMFPLPYVDPRDNSWKNCVGIKIMLGKLAITTAADWTGYRFFATIKYTKK